MIIYTLKYILYTMIQLLLNYNGISLSRIHNKLLTTIELEKVLKKVNVS